MPKSYWVHDKLKGSSALPATDTGGVAGLADPIAKLRPYWLQLILAVLYVGATLLAREIAFSVCLLALMAFFAGGRKAPLSAMSTIMPIVAIASIGLLVTLVSWKAGSNVEVLRQLFYFMRVPVFFLFGYLVLQRAVSSAIVFQAIIVLGSAGSLFYILRYAQDPQIAFESRNYIRSVIGHGSMVSWLVPFAAYALWGRQRAALRGLVLGGLSALSLVAIYLSTSRTGMMTVLVALFCLLFAKTLARHLRLFVFVALLVMIAITTPLMAWAFGMHALLPTLPLFLAELVPPPFPTLADVNTYWRGYETFTAFETILRNGSLAFLFGNGFSLPMNIGFVIELEGQLVREIPIFHSAFAFTMYRAGLVGVALYIWQIDLLARSVIPSREAGGSANWYFQVLSVALVYLMVLGTPTISGLLNGGEFGALGLVLIGYGAAQVRLALPDGKSASTPSR